MSIKRISTNVEHRHKMIPFKPILAKAGAASRSSPRHERGTRRVAGGARQNTFTEPTPFRSKHLSPGLNAALEFRRAESCEYPTRLSTRAIFRYIIGPSRLRSYILKFIFKVRFISQLTQRKEQRTVTDCGA